MERAWGKRRISVQDGVVSADVPFLLYVKYCNICSHRIFVPALGPQAEGYEWIDPIGPISTRLSLIPGSCVPETVFVCVNYYFFSVMLFCNSMCGGLLNDRTQQ